MSSGPVGLDVKEYSYSFYAFTVPTASPDVYRLTADFRWLVTRIRYWMPAGVPGFLSLGAAALYPINIAAGGCVCLEPNGAHRELVFVGGLGGLAIIEYWYQATPSGNPPVPSASLV